MNTVNCIMLVDDGEEFNFMHRIIIKHANAAKEVVAFQSADEALKYLQTNKNNLNLLPDLIFLDINMPRKTGWDFLDEFELLKSELSKPPVIIMLTSSVNPNDKTKAFSYSTVSDYCSKPLLAPDLQEIIEKLL